jgi:6-phosphogluconolactonase (cycloisomerase 2 family)
MFRRFGARLAVVLVWSAAALGAAVEKGEGRLTFVDRLVHDDLTGTVTTTISPDGKFIYSAAWSAGKVATLKRDLETGKLSLEQTIGDPDTLAGTTSIAVSPDGKLAVATAFMTRTVVLFQRDPETGRLTISDVARDGTNDVRLGFPIRAAFSPDGRHVYVIDDNEPEGEDGALVGFKFNDGKLELVGRDVGQAHCYSGARGVAIHPDGKTIFVTANRANTLVAADRDPATGKTSVRQVVRDDEGDVHALGGAFGTGVSDDGRFVYVASGRFQGDNSVSAYRLGSDGKLSLVQEVVDPKDFNGANQLDVSPDGRNLYVAGTKSRTVACFKRDPSTGRVEFLEALPDGGDGGENGAASVSVSPDGRFVHVATEDGRAVTTFRRETEK